MEGKEVEGVYSNQTKWVPSCFLENYAAKDKALNNMVASWFFLVRTTNF